MRVPDSYGRQKAGESRLPVRDLAYGGLLTALIAVGAFLKITIPVEPVPMHFTLQLFFVLLSGLLLGSRRGLLAVCAYLTAGLCGFPVFASGGGLSYLARPTFGFLLGFAAAAFLAGLVRERFSAYWAAGQARERFPVLLASAFIGVAADYAVGMAYFYFCSRYVLGLAVGWRVVLVNCFLLTVVPDLVLGVLAAMTARRLTAALAEWR